MCRSDCGGAPEFSDPTQVDAAAKVEEDEVLRNGGGTRAAQGHARKKTMERGRMRRDLSTVLIRKANKWAQKTRRPERGYPAARAPRFSGKLLKQRSVEICWILCKFMIGDVMAGYHNLRR